jgi:hypothetical protein
VGGDTLHCPGRTIHHLTLPLRRLALPCPSRAERSGAVPPPNSTFRYPCVT